MVEGRGGGERGAKLWRVSRCCCCYFCEGDGVKPMAGMSLLLLLVMLMLPRVWRSRR